MAGRVVEGCPVYWWGGKPAGHLYVPRFVDHVAAGSREGREYPEQPHYRRRRGRRRRCKLWWSHRHLCVTETRPFGARDANPRQCRDTHTAPESALRLNIQPNSRLCTQRHALVRPYAREPHSGLLRVVRDLPGPWWRGRDGEDPPAPSAALRRSPQAVHRGTVLLGEQVGLHFVFLVKNIHV